MGKELRSSGADCLLTPIRACVFKDALGYKYTHSSIAPVTHRYARHNQRKPKAPIASGDALMDNTARQSRGKRYLDVEDDKGVIRDRSASRSREMDQKRQEKLQDSQLFQLQSLKPGRSNAESPDPAARLRSR